VLRRLRATGLFAGLSGSCVCCDGGGDGIDDGSDGDDPVPLSLQPVLTLKMQMR